MKSIKTSKPVTCHLWTKTPLSIEDFDTFKCINNFFDDEHHSRSLLQCTECGQFYLSEYYETIDWVNGNDPQYDTYIPIEPSAATIEALNQLDVLELLSVTPRLQKDWSANGDRIRWIGKDDLPENVHGEELISKASALAHRWHQGATRKADGSPYIEHLKAVADLLVTNGFSDETIAAGFCHDLLEDTECPESEIRQECGKVVLNIVKTVTNDDSLPWKEKKLKYIASVRAGSDDAKAVCVVDKIHNQLSLQKAYREQGSAIWQHFNQGKKDKLWFEQSVLKMLQETWDHPLLEKYAELVERMEKLEG
ncbi:MAG: hypothetical protein COY81_01390 [Candidatus Pacebacteria bacterium CG_4_10_14_0_8_um_filter_43_12]|nr:MAG: hypothetical protein COY81_01390 [Candidatus Pacebacteria bacterium CG_4_10_14_0_8_um_filter_43_12]